MTTASPRFYQPGGTLRPGSSCYVERRADDELYAALLRSEFCYVLTSRQMGKSSLMAHTAARLREAGVAVVILDLTFFGRNLSPEQWYGDMLEQIRADLGLQEPVEKSPPADDPHGPLQRWLS